MASSNILRLLPLQFAHILDLVSSFIQLKFGEKATYIQAKRAEFADKLMATPVDILAILLVISGRGSWLACGPESGL